MLNMSNLYFILISLKCNYFLIPFINVYDCCKSVFLLEFDYGLYFIHKALPLMNTVRKSLYT